MSTKVQKLMTQPINLMFRFLQNVRPHAPMSFSTAKLSANRESIDVQKSRIQVWLYEQVNTRIEGRIMGFDEYMNLVLDDAEELDVKNLKRTPLGRILLKGDTITLMMAVDATNGSN
jgi:small nuclear ribonucleoprotein E